MEFTRDDRGVSEVIGAILVFGLLITLLAVMQTYAVPLANEEVEFNHNQDVQSDLVNFLEASSRTAAYGSQESTRLRMGTTYPSRLLFFSPSPPGGEIRTVGDQEASISNIESPNENVNQAILADNPNQIDGLEAKRLEYEPNYNEWRQPPTVVVEYGALYNDFGDQHTVQDDPDVLNGNTIDLTFFSGDLARTTGSAYSLTARPTSAPARTVSVQNAEDDPITITIPSRVSASDWSEMLDDEPRFQGAEDSGDGTVTLYLEPGQYSLRMAKIGVGGAVETPEAHYTTRASSRVQTITTEGAAELPIEVRDRYNNPVAGEDVHIRVSAGSLDGGGDSTTATANDQGQPMVAYGAPDEPGLVTVEASYENVPGDGNFDPSENKEDVRFQIAVSEQVEQIPPSVDSDSPAVNESSCQGNVAVAGIDVIEGNCAMSIDYDVSDGNGDLDTVEVRMIRTEDGTVADSVKFDMGEEGADSDSRRDVRLSDDDPPDDQEYQVRVIATDKQNLEDSRRLEEPHTME